MSTAKAWVYRDAHRSLENNIFLEDVERPKLTSPGSDLDVLVEVISASLNPVDYKIPEGGLLGRAMVRRPATPGLDFSGRIVATGAKIDKLAVGDIVFGRLPEPRQHGTLSQYIAVPGNACAVLPGSADPDQGAAFGTAALTAYQAIVPNVKAGDKVFINGGAGGTGIFAIQIAKTLGCHVTVTCSEAKAALCEDLGADVTIDYHKVNVVEQLRGAGHPFTLVIDLVGSSPPELYKACDDILLPEGKFVQVGGGLSMQDMRVITSRSLLPSFLGGGSRKFEMLLTKTREEELRRLAEWLDAGKVKAVIEQTFEFEDVPKAFEKLKKGRTAGKIVIHVGKK